MLGEGSPVAKTSPGMDAAAVELASGVAEIDATLNDLKRGTSSRSSAALGPAARRAGRPRGYRALDPELPASLSPEVIGSLLRRRLNFSGLVLSDDLEMAAVAGTWVSPARLAGS